MTYKFSCVLDYSPLMAVQSFIWLNNLLESSISPANIYMHVIGELPVEYKLYLESTGINLIECEVFDYRNKYCNKLVQLQTFQKIKDYDYVFLMDCDTALISLDELNLTDEVYAKIVDFSNPPEEVLKSVYEQHGFHFTEAQTSFCHNNKNVTDWNNCNGGVLIISRSIMRSLASKWISYSEWCIDNKHFFSKQYEKHADQVGFGMAMHSLKKKVVHLDMNWNCPIHVPLHNPELKPKIIHFHNRIDNQIKLEKTGVKGVDDQINLINSRISKAIRNNHLNSIFWDFRYQYYPELGSGLGSRGNTLIYKRKLLKKFIPKAKKMSVLDVGCGDLETVKNFKFKEYTGIDLSSEVIRQARIKRPDWNFQIITGPDFSVGNKDIVFCFDVLIHQRDFQTYNKIIKSLARHTTQRLLVAGYDREPEIASDITFFHEPISESLTKLGVFEKVIKIGEYRSTSVMLATKTADTMKVPIRSRLDETDSWNLRKVSWKLKHVIKGLNGHLFKP